MYSLLDIQEQWDRSLCALSFRHTSKIVEWFYCYFFSTQFTFSVNLLIVNLIKFLQFLHENQAIKITHFFLYIVTFSF